MRLTASPSVCARVDAEADGELTLWVDGSCVGAARPGGCIAIAEGLSLHASAEAALGLLEIVDRWPDDVIIAGKIAEFRESIGTGGGLAGNREVDPTAEGLQPSDMDFLHTFFDLGVLQEAAEAMRSAAREALLNVYPSQQDMETQASRLPSVTTSRGVFVVLTVVGEGEQHEVHLSMSRESRLPPVHARLMFALASWCLGLELPAEIRRSLGGVWHASWSLVPNQHTAFSDGATNRVPDVTGDVVGWLAEAARDMGHLECRVVHLGSTEGKPPN